MTEKPTENIITEADRELLAQAYEETRYLGGPFPSYADLARREDGAFTLCSLRAIARARLVAEAEIRADERKKVAAFVADFSWIVPGYSYPIDEVRDDVACAVCKQISAAILKLPESSEVE